MREKRTAGKPTPKIATPISPPIKTLIFRNALTRNFLLLSLSQRLKFLINVSLLFVFFEKLRYTGQELPPLESDIQQNMLPLPSVCHFVDTNRKGSKFSSYIELWLNFTDDAQHAQTNGHI